MRSAGALSVEEGVVIARMLDVGHGSGRRTCAVGEKGAMAGMVAGGIALALATPTMRGLT
ncbi:hypothetical protein BKH22_05555 [Actinomyces oris]|nr:hypothetical protein BKH22_05555 [Actinomyces oris]